MRRMGEGRCEDNGRRSVYGQWKVGVRIMEGRCKDNGRRSV